MVGVRTFAIHVRFEHRALSLDDRLTQRVLNKEDGSIGREHVGIVTYVHAPVFEPADREIHLRSAGSNREIPAVGSTAVDGDVGHARIE